MAKQLNVDMRFNADTSKAKQAIKDLEQSLQKLGHTTMPKDQGIDPAQFEKASAAARELEYHLKNAFNAKTGNLDLSKLHSSLQQSKTSLKDLTSNFSNAGKVGQQAFVSLAKTIATADQPALNLNTHLGTLWTTLKNVARFQLSSSIMHGLIGGIQSAYGYAQDLNTSLNNIRIVTGASTEEMAKFAEQANKSARALSTTTLDYTDAALIYYQQGIRDQKEIADRVETTVKLANVSRQSAEEVSSQMTAIWNNFDNGSKSLEYYADVITALGATTASSSQEIAGGLEKFASVAQTVGLSYEYAASALATIVAATRQSEDTVGTGLRTLFARFEGLKLGETLEDGVDLNKYSKALKTIGVDILDANGNLRQMNDILDDMGKRWDTLNQTQKVALAQTVGGVRQYTNLIALMDNWDKFQANVITAENSSGTIDKQAKIYAESWEAARDRVKAAAQSIYSSLIDENFFIGVDKIIEHLLAGISSFISSFGGVKNVLAAVLSFVLTMTAGKIGPAIQKVIQDIQVLTGGAQKVYQKIQGEFNTAVNSELKSGKYDSSAVMRAELQSSQNLLQAKTQLGLVNDQLSASEKMRAEIAMQGYQLEADEIKKLAQEVDNLAKKQQEAAEITRQANLEKQSKQQALNNFSAKDFQGDNQHGISVDLASSMARSSEFEKLKNSAIEASKALEDNLIKAFMGVEGASTQFGDKFKNIFEGIRSAVTEDTLPEAKNQLKDLQNLLISLLDDSNLDNGQLRKAFQEAFNAKDAKQFKSAVEGIGTAVAKAQIPAKDLAKVLKNTFGASEKNIDNYIKALEEYKAAEEAAKKAGENNAEAKKRLAEATKQLTDAQQKLNTEVRNFKPVHQVTSVEGIIKGAAALGNFVTVINSVKSAITTLGDDTASTGQKLTACFMAISMGIPAFMMMVNNFTTFKASLATLGADLAKLGTSFVSWGSSILFANSGLVTNAMVTRLATAEDKKLAAAGIARLLARKGLIAADEKGAIAQALNNIATEKGSKLTLKDVAVTILATMAKKGENTGRIASIALKLQEILVNLGLEASSAALLAITLLLVAALVGLALVITGIVVGVKLLSEWYNHDALAAQAAASAAKELANAYNEAKQAAEDLKSSIDKYENARKSIDDLTKGTVEWKEAIRSANEEALKLINTYESITPDDYYVDENGLIQFKDGVLEKAQKEQDDRVDKAFAAAELAQLRANQAQTQAEITQAKRNEHASGWAAMGYGAAAGGAAGALYGGVGAPVGALIGAGVGLFSSWAVNQDRDRKFDKAIERLTTGDLSEKFKARELSNADLMKELDIQDEDLIEAITNLATDINNNTAASESLYQVLVESEFTKPEYEKYADRDDVVKLSSKELEQLEKQIYEQVIDFDDKITKWAGANNKDVQNLWQRYSKATNTHYQLSNNAVQGSHIGDNYSGRVYEYIDENHEKKTVNIIEMAQAIAAYEALEQLGTSAAHAAEMLDKIKVKPESGYTDNDIKGYIATGNFEGSTEDSITAMRNEMAEKGTTEYVTELFGGEENLAALAQAYGISPETFIKNFENSLNSIDFGSISNHLSRAAGEAFDEAREQGYFKGTYKEENEIADFYQKIYAKLGTEGLEQLSAGLDLLEDNETRQAFLDLASGFDWTNKSVDDFQAEMAQLGIIVKDTDLMPFINAMSQAAKLPPTLEDVQKEFSEIEKIMGSLKLGSTISSADFNTYFKGMEEYFMLMGDGNYQLINDAKTFYEVVRKGQRDKYVELLRQSSKTVSGLEGINPVFQPNSKTFEGAPLENAGELTGYVPQYTYIPSNQGNRNLTDSAWTEADNFEPHAYPNTMTMTEGKIQGNITGNAPINWETGQTRGPYYVTGDHAGQRVVLGYSPEMLRQQFDLLKILGVELTPELADIYDKASGEEYYKITKEEVDLVAKTLTTALGGEDYETYLAKRQQEQKQYEEAIASTATTTAELTALTQEYNLSEEAQEKGLRHLALNYTEASDELAVYNKLLERQANGEEISEEELQEAYNRLWAAVVAAESGNIITETYKKYHNVIDNLKVGDTIDENTFQELFSGVDGAENYFILMADGTRKLIGDAEEFYNLVHEEAIRKIEERREAVNNFKNAGYTMDQVTNPLQDGQYYDLNNGGYSDSGKQIMEAKFAFLEASGIELDEKLLEAKQQFDEGMHLTPEQLDLLQNAIDTTLAGVTDLDEYFNKLEGQDLERLATTARTVGELQDLAAKNNFDDDTINAGYKQLATTTEEGQQALAEYNVELALAGDNGAKAAEATAKFQKKIKDIQANKAAEQIRKITGGVGELTDELSDFDAEQIARELQKVFGKEVTADFIRNNKALVNQWLNGTDEERQAAADSIELMTDAFAQDYVMPAIETHINIDTDDANARLAALQQRIELFKGIIANTKPTFNVDGTADMTPVITALLEAGATGEEVASLLASIANVEIDFSAGDWAALGELTKDNIDEWFTKFSNNLNGIDFNVSHFNVPAGGKPNMTSGGGGGGGGGGKNKEKEKKDPTDERDRYHTITEKIQDAKDAYDELSKAEDRAFGKERIKAMEGITNNLRLQIELQKKYLDEIRDYLEGDRAAVEALGATFDANGVITNYDDLIAELVAKYNEGVDAFNEGGLDEDAFKEQYEEPFNDAKEAIDQYVETINLLQSEELNLIDLQNDLADQLREIASYKLELHIDIDEDELKYLDFLLEMLGEDAEIAADRLAVLGDKFNTNRDEISAYTTAIQELLRLRGFSDEDVAAFIRGELIAGDLESRGFTSDDIDKLREYRDAIQENTQAMKELSDEIEQAFLDTLDDLNDKVTDAADRFEHFTNMFEHFKNVVDIVGQDALGMSAETMKLIAKSAKENAIEMVKAAKTQLDSLTQVRQQAQTQLDAAYEAQKNATTAEEKLRAQESIRYWSETIEEVTNRVNEAQENLNEKLEDALEGIKDAYTTMVEQATKEFEKQITGLAGSLESLRENFDRQKETQELYIPAYEKIYELTKLTRDIGNSIDDTDNLWSKRELAKLQDEINGKMADGVELTEHDVEELRKRYELKLAEAALEEARDSKRTVRMSRDNEGNWSYVYTADEDDVAAAEQNYEDKLYQYQQMNYEYIQELQDKIIQAEQDMTDQINDLDVTKFASKEAYLDAINRIIDATRAKEQQYKDQLAQTLEQQNTLYEDDWARYNERTGYRMARDDQWVDNWNETILAQETGFETLEDMFDELTGAIGGPEESGTYVGDITDAYAEMQASNERAFNAAGTSMQTYESDVHSAISGISDDMEETQTRVEEFAESLNESMEAVTDYISEWKNSYGDAIQELCKFNDDLYTSCQKLISALQQTFGVNADFEAAQAEAAQEALAGSNRGGSGGNGSTGGGSPGESPAEGPQQQYSFDKSSAHATGNYRKRSGTMHDTEYKDAHGLTAWIPEFHERQIWTLSMATGWRCTCCGYVETTSTRKSGQYKSGGYTGTWSAASALTGMYTGSWNGADVEANGRLAFLHQKELVLNADDTKNFLSAVDMVRQISQTIDLQAASRSNWNFLLPGILGKEPDTLDQNVHIEAHFPNVTSHSEIEEAFTNLVGKASQFANR